MTEATIRTLMDRAATEELFTFTDHGWNTYERAIRPHGDETLTLSASGSGWPALRDALAHITWAYVRWLADPAGTTDEPVERVESWDELDAYRRRDLGHTRGYFDSLGDDELMSPREMTSTAGRCGTAPRISSPTRSCTSASITGT